MKLHPTAVIDKEANLAESVTVGPYSIIEAGVTIGPDTEIGSHTVICGSTTIGARNRIGPFASIGTPAQDLTYRGEPTRLVIGDDNLIREYVTMHRGTPGGKGITAVGSHNFFMAYAHVAHDCRIGDHVVMANAATLGGHVEVEDRAIVGGLVAIHQFSRIGTYALIGGMSGINRDVPPYVIATGVRNEMRVSSLNVVGLKRAGFSEERIGQLKAAFKIIFKSPALLLEEALSKALKETAGSAEVAHLVEFFRSTRRSVLRNSRDND